MTLPFPIQTDSPVDAKINVDGPLLVRMRLGDEAAFTALYRRHQSAIYRFALQMCGSAAAAEDVTQETFMALFRQMHEYDESRGALVNYLYGIARHHVMKRLTAWRSETPLDQEHDGVQGTLVDVSTPSPFEDMARAEMVKRIRAAVSSLPPVYREVVVLCELHELEYVEAAEILECPVGTVRSRLHRARALLTTKLAAWRPAVTASAGGSR